MLWHTMKILHGKQQNSRLCTCYHKQRKRQGVVQDQHLYLHPLLPTSVASSFSLHPYVQQRTSAWWIPSHNVPGFMHLHPCCTISVWIPAESSQPSLHDTSLHADLTTPVPPPLNPFSVHHYQCFNRAQKVIPDPCILLQPHLLQLPILLPHIFKS